MRNLETVERCGHVHVIINGVESDAFASPEDNYWRICFPVARVQVFSLEKALNIIADNMDDWHTVAEAADRLAELGKADRPPSTKTMYRWIHAGRFPGAIKVETVGRGGSWRISETALREYEKGGEKK